MASGVDVVNDGEQPRVGFQTYVAQRMQGFGGESKRPRPRDYTDFPSLLAQLPQRYPRRSKVSNAPQAIAEVRLRGSRAGRGRVPHVPRGARQLPSSPVETFMTAASPGIIATTMLNAHYDSHEAYVLALARQMRKEYELIARDFILQIDAPDLALERTVLFQDKSVAEFLKIAEAARRGAQRGAGRHPARAHPPALLLGQLRRPAHPRRPAAPTSCRCSTQAKVGALSHRVRQPAPPARVRRAQEGQLPPEFILIPGVIDTTTNFVEHPEVVANRICEAVDAVGDRSRVIASSDCGFGTFAGSELVADDVVWAKLKALPRGRRHRDPAAVGQAVARIDRGESRCWGRATPVARLLMPLRARASPFGCERHDAPLEWRAPSAPPRLINLVAGRAAEEDHRRRLRPWR